MYDENKECPNLTKCGVCQIDEVRAFVKFINDCNRSRRDEEYGQRWEQRQVVNRR